jgi:uncharacterized protein (TIGR00661 family)
LPFFRVPLGSREGCQMRILYGVHGYGRGHATRTLAVLPHLVESHQLLILAGGDAFQTMSAEYPVVRIPTLGFAYDNGSGVRRRSNWQTLRHNLPALMDLLGGGPTFQMVCDLVREFGPDVVICDAEAWAHHVAAYLQIPRISFDHIGIMNYCRPSLAPRDRFEVLFDTAIYRLLMGRPDRIIVSSFFDAPPRSSAVRVVGALPRAAVRLMAPRPGEHLLVYLNRGQHQLHDGVVNSLDELGFPVRIYGTAQRGQAGHLAFLPPSDLPFLEDLASCRAVISTAGNQLVGEALSLEKPVLVFPECCAEQRMNARAVERLGIGMQASFGEFTAATIRKFLGRLGEFHENIRRHRRDGLPEALSIIDQFLRELAPAASAEPDLNAVLLSADKARQE